MYFGSWQDLVLNQINQKTMNNSILLDAGGPVLVAGFVAFVMIIAALVFFSVLLLYKYLKNRSKK